MTLTENEIRPIDLMAGLAVVVEADRKWLAERNEQFINVNCPACNNIGKHEFQKNEFNYERCCTCCTLFMNPRPSESLLHDFYSQSQTYSYWNKFIFPASEEIRREKIFAPRASRVLEFCERYHTKVGTLLEVGAGFGTFCEEIMARGKFAKVVALEMTPDLADSCRKRGLTVVEEPIETLSLPAGSVDVIASFETLEHLLSPREFLLAVHKMLATDGLLVLTCPRIEGFDVMTLGKQSATIDHEHLNYFTPTSLARLATDCGFKVLEVLTPGELDADIVRNKVLDGSISLIDQPWLKHVLVDRWQSLGAPFQSFLSENKLSSHLWMVASRD